MKMPILGQAYVARSVNAADNQLINLYPEVVPEGGKTGGFLTRAPGLRRLAVVGTGPIRGLWQMKSYGYVVSGSEFYRINAGWSATKLGDLTGSGTGPVSITDNGTQIFIACNPKAFVYDASTGTFGEITDPDFKGAVTVGFLDGYFVYNQPSSQKIWVTELYGTGIDPIDVASAEGSPDNLVALIVDHREVWLFGTNTVEVWYNTGGTTATSFPLERIQGAFNEIGCAAPYSVAKMDNCLFWLGSDARGQGIIYRAQGYTGQRISTHAVETAIQAYANLSDAIGYTYQQEGHSFYVLTFPSADATWVFDVATNAWHVRAGFSNGQFSRHRSNCQMAYNNEVVVGDYANGNLYAFDQSVYVDYDTPQKWVRSFRALGPDQNNLKRTTHHMIQIDCESGVGLNGVDFFDPVPTTDPTLDLDFIAQEYEIEQTLVTTQGVNPQMALRWSDDGGHTWSNEYWSPMGRIGAYGTRVVWRRLGMTLKLRDRVYELSGTDPVKITIMGAELIVSGTNA